MKAAEWIDRVKTAHGWDSDYKVSKELGLTRQVVSRYRNNPTTMDDETAIKVANSLGAAPEVVLLDQVVERTKSEPARIALSAALKRLGGVAASLAMCVGVVSAPSPAEARSASVSGAGNTSSVYYVKRRTQRRRNAMDVIRDTLAGSFCMAV